MIKIEVTGNSIPEVADKLLAIGASLRNSASQTADDRARQALQDLRDKIKVVHVSADGSEAIPFEKPKPAAKPAKARLLPARVDVEPIVEAVKPEPVAEAVKPEPEIVKPEGPVSVLNFETEVAPVVIQFVQKVSKERTGEILAEFGVERASMMDPTLWPELVERLRAEMA